MSIDEFGYNFSDPKFTDKEYRSRMAKIRQGMKKRDIELLLLFSPKNLFYLSGFLTIGMGNFQTLIVTQDKETLYVREMETGVCKATSWVQDIVFWEDHQDPVAVLVDLLKKRGLVNNKVSMEKNSLFLVVQEYDRLVDKLGFAPSDGSDVVNEVRLIKSPQEIAYLRKAASITDIGLKAAYESLAAGKTENDVVADLFGAMIRAGSDPLVGSPIVTGGYKSGIAHTNWHRLVLQKGDAVLLEFTSTWNTYHSPLMRTVVIGEPNTEIKKMYDACRRGLEAAISAMRPGVTSGEVDEACRGVIEAAGYEHMFRKRTGYSVGVGPFPWGEGGIMDLKRDDPRVLKAGMVFHMPPALRDYKKCGVGISETVLVTETGAEPLGKSGRELFVVTKTV